MRRRLPGVEPALSAAVDRVRRMSEQLPDHLQPDLAGERWHRLEGQIDRACGNGDRDAALLAIERWERHASEILTRLLVHAPLRAGEGERR